MSYSYKDGGCMEINNNKPIWHSLITGFTLYIILSFFINAINIAFIFLNFFHPFFSPAFSKYYLVLSLIPLTLINNFHSLTDNAMFIVVSITAIFADGLFGTLLSFFAIKVLKTDKLKTFLLITFPFYWLTAVSAFSISF
ncbi:hypothetical protein DEAC_c43380 [Desulfosporosinus acididurans]|uniref:Uncharacterized protein n=1 Tax=Desulfosporosinus acididurans TaxID=476652 RepID=A0A0J1FJW5_9FIRM|nr:hypothetical protein DEAC_c43380 [Desulfosporosinus acididurans]